MSKYQTASKQKAEKAEMRVLSKEDYNKKVTIAMAHNEYFNHMSRQEALRKAHYEVAQEYLMDGGEG